MRSFMAVLVATAFLSTAGNASAQLTSSELSNGYIGDEGDQGAGSLDYCQDRDGAWFLGNTEDNSFPPEWGWGGVNDTDPSCSWLAEDNGFPAPTTLPRELVLNGEWRSGNSVAAELGATKLVHRLDLPQSVGGVDVRTANILVPGTGQFWAWYGLFADLQEDGWIEDHQASERVHVATRPLTSPEVDPDCENELRDPVITGDPDPNGLGNNNANPLFQLAGVGPATLNTGVSFRCNPVVGDEWDGDNSATIVFYVTPGDYNDHADYINPICCVGIHNNTAEPDFYAQASTSEGEETGRYFGPTSNFDYVILDNGVLETTVVEVISNPVPGTARSEDRGTGSLADVDLYTSVNPDLEKLYQDTVVNTTNAIGCDVDWSYIASYDCPLVQRVLQIEHDVEDLKVIPCLWPLCGPPVPPEPVPDCTEPVDPCPPCTDGEPCPFDPYCEEGACSVTDIFQAIDSLTQTDKITGPVNNLIAPDWDYDPADDGFDSTENYASVDYTDTGGHLYFDQRLVSITTSTYGPIAAQDLSFDANGLGGQHQGILQTEIHAVLGIWEDNGDDVIGVWQEDSDGNDGCPDIFDCGLDNDPNSYSFDGSSGEYTPVCGEKDTVKAVNAPGSYYAYLTPQTTDPDTQVVSPANWVGVYLLTDRDDIGSTDDPLVEDGRQPFNPQDDIILDITGEDNNGDPDPERLNLYHGENTTIEFHMVCDGGFFTSYERLIFVVPQLTYEIKLTGTARALVGSATTPESRPDTDIYDNII